MTNPTSTDPVSNVTLSGPGSISDNAAIDITPAALGSFTMTGYPLNATAGQPFASPDEDVTVTAYDIYDNLKTDYTGPVSWSSTDPSATYPTTGLTFSGASKTFSGSAFTLRTAGNQTITVSDNGVSESSNNITVNTASLNNFTLTAGTTQIAGTGFNLSVSGAVDGQSNPWSGTIVVSVFSGGGDSPNGDSPILTNISVSNGSGSSTQILYNAVSTVLRGSADGVARNTGTITVNPAILGSFTMTGYPLNATAGQPFTSPAEDVTVTAYDIYGNLKTNYTGPVSWSSTDGAASLPTTGLTFSGASKTFPGTQFTLNTAGN